MSKIEAMNIDERRKYIHNMWRQYRQGKKREKGRLLDEIEAVTGMHRKAIIRLLYGRLSRKKRSRELGKEYGVQVGDTVRVIARRLAYPCAECLQPNLVWMAQHLQMHGELRFGKEVLDKLENVSVLPLKRMLKLVGRNKPKLTMQQPKRPQTTSLYKLSPMSKIACDIAETGHFEVDLVHQSGENAIGEYFHTLQMVNIATGWSEIVAIFRRCYRVMADGFDYLYWHV